MTDAPRMISFAEDGDRFTLRVAGVCLHEERVLLQQAGDDQHWILPGGRVHHGEAGADAIARELREELATDVCVERLLWVVENFFLFLGERYHEIGLYYLFTLPVGSPWVDHQRDHRGREGEVELLLRWIPFGDLPRLRLYPSFLRQALARVPATTEWVVHRDDETP